MKLLDYAGLSRLTANIKSYIADKLQPIDDRTTYYVKGAYLVRNNAFLGNGGYNDNFAPNGSYSTSDTGNKRAFLDRMLKGIPPSLLFDTAYSASSSYLANPTTQIPFYLKQGRFVSRTEIVTVYESAIGYGEKTDFTAVLTFTINAVNKTMSCVFDYGPFEEALDTTLLPLKWEWVSVDADGNIVGTHSAKAISASSTGDDLTNFNNISKGYPPCLYIDMVCSDSKTRRVFLNPTTINGTSRNYAASGFGNGTKTGLNLTIRMIDKGTSFTIAALPTA